MLACPQVFDPEFRKGFPNVQRWYTTLTHFPHFSAVFQVKDLAKERLKGTVLSSTMPVHTSDNLICAQVCIASKCYPAHIASKVNNVNTPCCWVFAGMLCACKGRLHSSLPYNQDSLQTVIANYCHGHLFMVKPVLLLVVPVPVLELMLCWCSSEACSAAKGTAAAETKGPAAAKAQGAGTKTSPAASGEPTHI